MIGRATKGILGGAGEINIVSRFSIPLFLTIKDKKPNLTLSVTKKKLLTLTIKG